LQVRAYRAMTPSERVYVAAVMSDEGIAIAESGIRSRHPDYDDEQVRRALMRLRYGRRVCERVWPNEEIPRP
jgi:hypothetical protein